MELGTCPVRSFTVRPYAEFARFQWFKVACIATIQYCIATIAPTEEQKKDAWKLLGTRTQRRRKGAGATEPASVHDTVSEDFGAWCE